MSWFDDKSLWAYAIDWNPLKRQNLIQPATSVYPSDKRSFLKKKSDKRRELWKVVIFLLTIAGLLTVKSSWPKCLPELKFFLKPKLIETKISLCGQIFSKESNSIVPPSHLNFLIYFIVYPFILQQCFHNLANLLAYNNLAS